MCSLGLQDVHMSHGGLDTAVRASGYEHSKEEDTVFLEALTDRQKESGQHGEDSDDDSQEEEEEVLEGVGAERAEDQDEDEDDGEGYKEGEFVADGDGDSSSPLEEATKANLMEPSMEQLGKSSWCDDDNPYAEGGGYYEGSDDARSSTEEDEEKPVAAMKKSPGYDRKGKGKGRSHRGRRRW